MPKPKSDDITIFHECDVHVPSRTIYMGSVYESETDDFSESGCDAHMAERVVKNIHLLDSIDDSNITILMNNVGGDEYHCFAIYDAIKQATSNVVIKVYGHAMSAGSIILQAADHRIMAPTSRQMIHYGTWGHYDHALTERKWSDEGQKINHWMEQMYLERVKNQKPKFTLKQLKEMLAHDTFLTAQESVDYGLADEVLLGKKGFSPT